MAEQDKPTGKESWFDYVKELKKLEPTNKKVKLIIDGLVSNLDVLSYPLKTIMDRIENDGSIIKRHWNDYGDNYSSLPVLHSTVPRYEESFGEFVGLSFKEKLILVNVLKKLFKLADKHKEDTIEILPEKEDVEPEKKK